MMNIGMDTGNPIRGCCSLVRVLIAAINKTACPISEVVTIEPHSNAMATNVPTTDQMIGMGNFRWCLVNGAHPIGGGNTVAKVSESTMSLLALRRILTQTSIL